MDDIEREIVIDAPVATVWGLVSEAGWWIGDGDRSRQTRSREADDVDVVTDPRYGSFRIRTEKSDPPRYVAYRWLDDGDERATTLVEFWLSEAETSRDVYRCVPYAVTRSKPPPTRWFSYPRNPWGQRD